MFKCANENCKKPLNDDPVILITTAHVRRFCHVECIIEGYDAHVRRLLLEGAEGGE